jgi:hypothetical protein
MTTGSFLAGTSEGSELKSRYFSPRLSDRSRTHLASYSLAAGTLRKGVNGWSVKVATQIQLMPRSRICGSINPLPICYVYIFNLPEYLPVKTISFTLSNLPGASFAKTTGDKPLRHLWPKRSRMIYFTALQYLCAILTY